MAGLFTGIRHIHISELGVSQIYISAAKLSQVKAWFSPQALESAPLPVHDFGNGQYTLTDGHTRAVCAFIAGMDTLPVTYDTDDIIICAEGQLLYRTDIEWCRWHGINAIANLANRIVSDEDYKRLWIARCDAGYELMTRTNPEQRAALASLYPEHNLFGASPDLCTLYFEDHSGNTFETHNGGGKQCP